MVERFRVIGETLMRDLPLYNGKLEVEALGFRRVDDQWIGVLVTPWFMNLIRLPEKQEPMELATIGHKRKVMLPSGEREMMQSGDEEIGRYDSLSLHSPMYAFETQEAARQEAQRQLEDLMRPSESPQSPDEDGRLSAPKRQMSRRSFFTGGSADE